MKRIPACIKITLWSYDIAGLDAMRDRRMIIERVLNYGHMPAVKWLINRYGRREIRRIIANPSRGVWLPEVLTFWLTILKIKLTPQRYHRALFILDPIQCQRVWKKHKIDLIQK